MPMPKALDAARYELALANRIIAHEGVLDGFGHVSMRHPSDPARYLLGRSLARALGAHWMVLMRRHGATVVGSTLQELVFRTIYSHANAEIQLRSMLLGKIAPLSQGETELTGPYQLQPRPMGRAWEYWTTRLEDSGGLPPARRGAAKAPAAGKPRASKSSTAAKSRSTSRASSARRAR